MPPKTKPSIKKTKAEPSIKERALQLLKNPDFCGKVRQAVARGGLVGEEQNALATYVNAMSSVLDCPLSEIVKGPSAGGKNFLASGVLRLFPSTAIREITSSSETAWNYAENDFRNKIVYLQERNNASGAVYPIRLLISERKITRIVTVWEGGKRVKKAITAEGPITAISTSTRDRIEIDDETRLISLWIDDSEAQTRQIVKRQLSSLINEQLSSLVPLSPEETEVWHEAYKLVSERASVPIQLPDWFENLGDKVYVGDISVRRFFPAFLTAVRTIVLLRSFQQHPEDFDAGESITVKFTDYAITQYIFDDVFVASYSRETECVETSKAIESIAATQNDEPVDADQLSKYLAISYDKASKKLREAVEAGTIEQANLPERNNSKRYLRAKATRFLPDPREVASDLVKLKKPVELVHPVTGKKLIFGGK
jgi:hypothetical protein